MMTDAYRALREGAAWLDLSARGRIVARGRDRARFLHNLTTANVKAMLPGASCYAFSLTPQGRIVGDLDLLCRADDFLIDTEPELREKLRVHISKYKVADQVELEDVTDSTAAIGVEGPSAPPPPDGAETAPFTITGQPGYRIYCKPEEKSRLIAVLEAAGVVAAAPEDARLVRIENGKPRYGEDILETTLPQESNQMHGVAFNKGCYLGQEIVERIRARGHVNKQLQKLELEGDSLPAPGTKLTIDGKEADVTSAVYSPALQKVIALAYVRV
jgi:folate-binding protein YgfZ